MISLILYPDTMEKTWHIKSWRSNLQERALEENRKNFGPWQLGTGKSTESLKISEDPVISSGNSSNFHILAGSSLSFPKDPLSPKLRIVTIPWWECFLGPPNIIMSQWDWIPRESPVTMGEMAGFGRLQHEKCFSIPTEGLGRNQWRTA